MTAPLLALDVDHALRGPNSIGILGNFEGSVGGPFRFDPKPMTVSVHRLAPCLSAEPMALDHHMEPPKKQVIDRHVIDERIQPIDQQQSSRGASQSTCSSRFR